MVGDIVLACRARCGTLELDRNVDGRRWPACPALAQCPGPRPTRPVQGDQHHHCPGGLGEAASSGQQRVKVEHRASGHGERNGVRVSGKIPGSRKMLGTGWEARGGDNVTHRSNLSNLLRGAPPAGTATSQAADFSHLTSGGSRTLQRGEVFPRPSSTPGATGRGKPPGEVCTDFRRHQVRSVLRGQDRALRFPARHASCGKIKRPLEE